ncbi:arsenate reductase family protein [Primorskyibacter sp. S187A]|uniref:arsenate reductase family protein n=1 Tax=Primorskyibacter sp. S187A TaxID=3415130 RepID=UPI003C7DA721
MTLYGLKTCGTCRRALAALPQATFVDVRKEGVPEEVLSRAEALFGDKLVNTRSTTWRELSEDARAKPKGDLLRAHPTLMKRPLIDAGDQMYLGWDTKTEAALV